MYILVLLSLLGEPSTQVAAYDSAGDCLDVLDSFVIAAPNLETLLTCEKE